MFSGDESVRFSSSSPKGEVLDQIESALQSLGTVDIGKRGDILIYPRRSLGNFLTKTTIEGDVREKSGDYTVTLEYKCSLSGVGWVILILGILFLLVGLLVLLGPMLKKNDVSQAVRRALRDID